MTIEAINIVATGLPKTIEEYQLALNAAFSGGKAFGEAVMQGRTIKLAMAEANDKRLEALAQSEQEPFGWYSAQEDDFMTHKIRKEHERLNSYTHKVGKFDLALYTTSPQPKEPNQEPVGHFYFDEGQWKQAHDPISFPGCTKLYKAPQRKPLTDEELFKEWEENTSCDMPDTFEQFKHTARAIEAAHRIKE